MIMDLWEKSDDHNHYREIGIVDQYLRPGDDHALSNSVDRSITKASSSNSTYSSGCDDITTTITPYTTRGFRTTLNSVIQFLLRHFVIYTIIFLLNTCPTLQQNLAHCLNTK